MSNISDVSITKLTLFMKHFDLQLAARGISLFDSEGNFHTVEYIFRKLMENADSDSIKQSEAEDEDMVNHPAHYNMGKRECIEEMELLFGPDNVAGFCRCSAYKYKSRAGSKPGNSKEQDLAKADWFIDYLDDMIRRYSEEPTPARIGFTTNKEAAA